MHEEFHTLGVGILVQSLDVEVWIWGHEVEDIVLVAVRPVLPADIPAFHKDLVEAVLRGEVNVPADILIVGTVGSVRLAAAVVCHSEMN